MSSIELTVDRGHEASASRFFQAGAALLALLDELADEPQDWVVRSLHTGSAVAEIEPLARSNGGRALRLAFEGLERVREGQAPSDDWSPDAIHTARQLAEIGAAADPPPQLRLVDARSRIDEPLHLDESLASILRDLQPFERAMPGAIRGQLVGLNISRGNRASIRLPNRRIVRVSFRDELLNEFKELMLKQVQLDGEVRQDADGRPFHIRALAIDELPGKPMSWVDLAGFAPELTGGKSVEEFLRDSRGEE